MSKLYQLVADRSVELCLRHAKEHPAWPGSPRDWDACPLHAGECMVCDPAAHATWRDWQRSLPEPDDDWLRRTFYRAQPMSGLDLFASFLEAFALAGVNTPSLAKYPGTTKDVRYGRVTIQEPCSRVGAFAAKADALQFGAKGGDAGTSLADCLLSSDAAEMRAHLIRRGKV